MRKSEKLMWTINQYMGRNKRDCPPSTANITRPFPKITKIPMMPAITLRGKDRKGGHRSLKRNSQRSFQKIIDTRDENWL